MTHVEIFYPTTRDVSAWESAHRRNEVPDLWPYGLNKVSDGRRVSVTATQAKRLRPVHIMKTLAWPHQCKRGSSASAGVAIAWDEDLALRLASERPNSPKYAGVIWVTDRQVRGERSLKDVVLAELLARFEGLWTLSRAQIPIVEGWLGRKSPPVHFVPFGIDHKFFVPYKYPDEPVVLSVGRDRDRDPKTLFAAMEEVLRIRPDVRVVVQTDAPCPVPRGVSTIPTMSHVALRDYYRKASVVAVATRPNVHVSGMTVALEAMATARPVVMSDTPGMRDYVDHGDTGVLVPAEDPKRFAEAVLAVLGDPVAAENMGQAGRSKVELSHTTDSMAAHLRGIVTLGSRLPAKAWLETDQ